MKYLKLFEDINQYYYSINKSIDKYYDENCLTKFSDDEFNKIKNVIENKSIFLKLIASKFNATKFDYNHKPYDCILIESRSHELMQIFKLEDEWYIAKVIFTSNREYYKCDQMEGLIKCLEDLFIK